MDLDVIEFFRSRWSYTKFFRVVLIFEALKTFFTSERAKNPVLPSIKNN